MHSPAYPEQTWFAPRVPRNVLSRARLSERLDDGSESGLTIVRGPAGSGKTVAIASWLQSSTLHAERVWVSVDDSLTDRFAFWRRVMQALVDSGKRLPVPISELIAGEEPLSMLRERLRRALSTLSSRTVLIFDDFHHAARSGVDDDLIWLLQKLDGLHVVVGSRTLTSLETNNSFARLSPTVITPHELTFTADEAREAVSLLMPSLRPELAGQIHEATGGWPLATRLLVIELERSTKKEQVASVAAAVAAHLPSDSGTKFLSSLPDASHTEFALATSVASAFTAELAELLSPGADVAAMLAWFETEGLGSWHLSAPQAEFRWQPLVRLALVDELRRGNAERWRSLQLAYAGWLAEHGSPMVAIAIAVDAHEYSMVDEIVRQSFSDLMQYHQPELRAVLAVIPGRELRRHVSTVATLVLLNYTSPSSSRERLFHLTQLSLGSIAAQLRNPSPTERLWLHTNALAVQRASGNYAHALTTASKIRSLAASFDSADRDTVGEILPISLTQVGASYLYADQIVDAVAVLQSIRSTEHQGSAWTYIHVESLLALIAALEGDSVLAAGELDVIRRRNVPHGWWGTYAAAGYHLAEAELCLDRGDTVSAATHVTALDAHSETLEHWPLLMRLEGIILLMSEPTREQVAQFSKRMFARERRTSTSPVMWSRLNRVYADLLVATGQPGRAESVVAEHVARFTELELTRARLLLLTGAPEEAIAAMDTLALDHQSTKRVRSEATLLRAVAERHLGRSAAALNSWHSALELVRGDELLRTLTMVPRDEIDAFLTLSPVPWVGEVLSRLPIIFSSTMPIPRLTERELEVLRALQKSASVQEIAAALFVSPNTVKSQLRSAYRKLGVGSREDALSISNDRGLLR